MFVLILDMYLSILVLLAALFVYLRRAPCLLLIRTPILSEFDLILLIVVNGGEESLSIGVGNVAVSCDAVAALV